MPAEVIMSEATRPLTPGLKLCQSLRGQLPVLYAVKLELKEKM